MMKWKQNSSQYPLRCSLNPNDAARAQRVMNFLGITQYAATKQAFLAWLEQQESNPQFQAWLTDQPE